MSWRDRLELAGVAGTAEGISLGFAPCSLRSAAMAVAKVVAVGWSNTMVAGSSSSNMSARTFLHSGMLLWATMSMWCISGV